MWSRHRSSRAAPARLGRASPGKGPSVRKMVLGDRAPENPTATLSAFKRSLANNEPPVGLIPALAALRSASDGLLVDARLAPADGHAESGARHDRAARRPYVRDQLSADGAVLAGAVVRLQAPSGRNVLVEDAKCLYACQMRPSRLHVVTFGQQSRYLC
jgi:hypothetical protein